MFLILGIALNVVRLERKTYLADMVTANKGTAFVAANNTVIVALLLEALMVIGIIGAYPYPVAMLMLSIAIATGALPATQLKEAGLKNV